MESKKSGFWNWIKRWFCCGYREEQRVKQIYMKINCKDDIWSSEI